MQDTVMNADPHYEFKRDVSLEVFLDKTNLLMRSIENNNLYFEVEYDYSPEAEEAIESIENNDLSNKRVRCLFDGLNQKDLEKGVTCHITDTRNDEKTVSKTIILHYRNANKDDDECSEPTDQSNSDNSISSIRIG